MGTVAVTGVSGLIGRRLVRALEDVADVDRVIGIDVTAPEELRSSKLEMRTADIRDERVGGALEGADTVVHLAFVLDPDRDEDRMRSVNVDGTRNVAETAAAVGARKLVYLSSATAYGAHPDNPIPLPEDAPLRANPGFNYAEHKFQVEQWLWPWSEQRTDLTVTVLRPSIVAGPGVNNFISRAIEAPRLTMVKGHKPPWQFVHVDDVAAAIVHVIARDLPGAFNVSAEGWLSFDEVLAIAGKRPLEVPEEVAFSLTDQLWRIGLGEYPAGVVHYFMHPWVVDVDKLVSTGWRPRHSNRDALAALVEEHRRYIALFGQRASKSTLRAGALAVGGAAAAALTVRALAGRRNGR